MVCPPWGSGPAGHGGVAGVRRPAGGRYGPLRACVYPEAPLRFVWRIEGAARRASSMVLRRAAAYGSQSGSAAMRGLPRSREGYPGILNMGELLNLVEGVTNPRASGTSYVPNTNGSST